MFINDQESADMPRTILRLPAVLKRRGKCRSAHYADIKAGLFVQPVKLGLRARGTPDDEVDALVAATIADRSEDQIRELVIKLEAARRAERCGSAVNTSVTGLSSPGRGLDKTDEIYCADNSVFFRLVLGNVLGDAPPVVVSRAGYPDEVGEQSGVGHEGTAI